MDFFDVIMLLGGVALFLFGMNIMTAGLEKTAGGRLEAILQKVTSNRLKAFALGVGITSLIQSSSAVTVMLVGLVNSRVMQLHQTVGVIIGTNIGTTVTAWILSLTGLTGDSFIVNILKPDNFAQIFAVFGIVCLMFSKKTKRRNVGEILLGFAVLLAGMAIMRDSVSVLESSESFRNILTAFSNPLLGVLIGVVITSIIQSSSASVGILQALSLTAKISFSTAIPVILGMKIGTCITALLSSIGTNKNARRVAVIHIYFNIIEAILILAVIYISKLFIELPFMDTYVTPVSIAIVHTLLSLVTTVVLLPFANQLEKLARLTIKGGSSEDSKYEPLDERLLVTPSLAIGQCSRIVVEMSHIARTSMLLAIEIVEKYSDKSADIIRDSEDTLDAYEDKLNTFLIKIAALQLSADDSWKVSEMLHIIGDLERMGDHALNILESADEMKEKDILFTTAARQDLDIAHAALKEIIRITLDAFQKSDIALARQVEPLEEVIDNLTSQMRSRHITRLQKGECAIVPGFIWSDLLINYERISDHCSNIALSVIQRSGQVRQAHGYFSSTNTYENVEFKSLYDTYSERYKLNH